MNTASLLLIGAALPIALFSFACKRDEGVRAYRAPKEPPTVVENTSPTMPTDDAGPAAAPLASAPDSVGDLHWTLPSGWKQVPVAPAAQFAPDVQLQVSPSDPSLKLGISHLGDAPMARSVVGNVNRWENQLGLPPTPEAELQKVVTPLQVGDVTISVVDLGGNGKRLLGAIIPHATETWFFKLSGPADGIASHKTEFDAFVRSVRFDAAAAVAGAPAPTAPSPSVAASGAGGATWTMPAGWSADPGPPPQMRLATLHAGGNGEIEIKVSKLGGTGLFGGLAANVTRWHGDVGLDPVDDATAQPGQQVKIGERTWTIYDYTGPKDGGRREIVASTPVADQTWYFKLAGPTDSVGKQKAAFDTFLASIRFSGEK
ncbi:MAG: hypothetical protein JWP03_131 [Phycisphaerales bacterium]|nr:hypothetical protein [Phycisphaerales bacterium]